MRPEVDTNLPPGSAPSLALAHPSASELLHQTRLNAPEWRGALSTEAYLRREKHLASQALTSNGGISYWILVDNGRVSSASAHPTSGDGSSNGHSQSPNGSRVGTDALPSSTATEGTERLLLASCETYRKHALVWREGTLSKTICHGIGSVYCAKQFRGKGYAKRMLEEVGRRLQTYQIRGNEECLFSILFSDIGKNFYAKLGWEPFASSHIDLAAHVEIPASIMRDLPASRPLHADDLDELCRVDEGIIRKTLESRPKGSKTAVALLPDIETMSWHHAREEFVGREVHDRVPAVKGAIVGTVSGKRAWCVWSRTWYNPDASQAKGNTLHILRMVIEDEGRAQFEGSGAQQGAGGNEVAIAALLLAAHNELQKWKLEQVQVWNPSLDTVAAVRRLAPEAKVVHRDTDSIASLKWYPAHEGLAADSIDWISNEKYGWC